ncbi:MAG: WXG100 family type VII secretion target [Lachnospiraceae bacterium]|nr:WXG100 family type VII secretion target [Lachnospiraceae bacterium]
MATASEIMFNYRKAMDQVKALNAIAADLKKIGNNSLSDCMNQVKKSWKGDNADAYVGKGNQLKQKVTKSSDNVSKVAGTLSSMAARIKDAELRNLETIRTITNK